MQKYWALKIDLPNKDNQKAINEFLLQKKNENRSQRLIENYRRVLQSFFKDRNESFSALTAESIQKDIEGLMSYQLKTLGTFYRFCISEGYVEFSPIKRAGGEITDIKKVLANSENQKVLNRYLLYMKELKRSDSTIINHRKTLQHFFLEVTEPFCSLTTVEIEKWRSKQEKVWSFETLYIRLSILRTFFYYCVEEGYMENCPVTTPKRKREKGCWKVVASLANQQNKTIINEFLVWMKVSNYSMGTIEGYKKVLQRFFIDREDPFWSLESEDILTWMNHHRGIWKESTLYSNLSVLHSFFNFCVEEEYMEKTIMKKRWYPRLPQPVPKYLDKEEVAKIRQSSEKKSLRSRAILEFFLASGCRVGEVVGLDRNDVDFDNRTARVMGKGKKVRVVHFTEKCALLLERYIESRTDDDPALFATNFGTRLHVGPIRNMLRKLGVEAQLSSSLYPHRLRHTFATNLLAKGADLSFIGEELGHSNLQTTQIYARLPKSKITSMYRKYMG